jgi:hypothetical protein
LKKTASKFRSFSEAEKADRDFYKKLTGNQRLQILVELLNHDPEQSLKRVSRTVNSRGGNLAHLTAPRSSIPMLTRA